MVVAGSEAAHLQKVVCLPCSLSMHANLDLFGTHLALSLYNPPISSLMADLPPSFHSTYFHSCPYLLVRRPLCRLKDNVSHFKAVELVMVTHPYNAIGSHIL